MAEGAGLAVNPLAFKPNSALSHPKRSEQLFQLVWKNNPPRSCRTKSNEITGRERVWDLLLCSMQRAACYHQKAEVDRTCNPLQLLISVFVCFGSLFLNSITPSIYTA